MNPSDLANQHLENHDEKHDKNNNNESNGDSIRRFKYKAPFDDSNSPCWEGVLKKTYLYIFMTANHMNEGSREAFVSLLEHAEEELGCTHVIVCIDKKITQLKKMMRNFLFLGFQMLDPGHELSPPMNPNVVSFVYNI